MRPRPNIGQNAGAHWVERAATRREARRGAAELLAYGMDHAPSPLKEDERQTRRDVRAALVFGIVAATIELGVILYFMR
jgi:hypothetical protein